MFIPLFIAVLLGFVSPSANNQNADSHGGTTVNVNSTDPSNSNDPNNSGDPGNGDPGEDGGDTGGEHGHMPPPKKN